MSQISNAILSSLYARKIAGEKPKALATEAGVTTQKLMHEFKVRNCGVCHNCGEAACLLESGACQPCEDERAGGCPSVPVEEAAVVEAVVVPDAPVVEPVAKVEARTWSDEQIDAAVQARRDGKSWAEIGVMLGTTWNKAWNLVIPKAPELNAKTTRNAPAVTRFTVEEVEAAAKARREGKGWSDIAKERGCTWNSIWNAVVAKHPELNAQGK